MCWIGLVIGFIGATMNIAGNLLVYYRKAVSFGCSLFVISPFLLTGGLALVAIDGFISIALGI